MGRRCSLNAHTEAVPALRVVSPETAEREGFRAITTPICAKKEPNIFNSVQASLKGIDAVWIEGLGERYTAARKAFEIREITEVESLLTADERRDRDADHVLAILDELKPEEEAQ